MSGLLRRLTGRRAATADETGPSAPGSSDPVDAPAPAPAHSGGDSPVVEQTPEPVPARDLPAGIDPWTLAEAPAGTARRGRQRRRLRYLRRVRELLLRDLGGFAYEVHRSAGGRADGSRGALIRAKAERLAALDAEVLELEARLGAAHDPTVLREPGVGGGCPFCGELHASDAQFCARCGMPLTEGARRRHEAEVAAAATARAQAAATPPQAAQHEAAQHQAAQHEAAQHQAAQHQAAPPQAAQHPAPPEPASGDAPTQVLGGEQPPATGAGEQPAAALPAHAERRP
jgi:hypothetical protein